MLNSIRIRPLTRSDASSNWLAYLWPALLLCICLLPILIYIPFVDEPLGQDEGAYATIAKGLLHGDIPYRDLFDHKPPLIYVWYAASFLVFDTDIESPRILASIVWSITTLFVFLEAKLLWNRRIGYIAATIFALSRGLVLLDAVANTEAFMLLPATAGLYAFTKGVHHSSRSWLFAAGACIGLAIFTKQIAVWQLLAMCTVLALLAVPQRRYTQFLRSSACLALGSAVIALAVIGPFVLTGSFADFYYANVTYNDMYSRHATLAMHVNNFYRGTFIFLFAAAPLVGGTIVAVLTLALRRRSWQEVLLLAWLAASVLGVMTGGRYSTHYFVQLLPAMAIMSALALTQLEWRGFRKALVLGALPLLLCLSIGLNVAIYLEPSPIAKHLAKDTISAKREAVSMEIAAVVASLTSPGQKVYEYGRDSEIYFYANRQPAIRFMYDRPFWLDPQTLDEAIRDLEVARPRLIVDTMPLDPQFYSAAFEQFRELHYVYETKVGYATIYRLKD